MTRTVRANTAVYAILGNPVEHSLSPPLHNAVFQYHNLNKVFVAFRVRDIGEAVRGVRALGIRGLSVTIPHKQTIIPHLDEFEPVAEAIGAVNTVYWKEDQLVGTNTDGYGALRALEENKIPLDGAKILILGTGGAGRAIAMTLILERRPETVMLASSRKHGLQAKKLLSDMKRVVQNRDIRVVLESITDTATLEFLKQVDLLINTTPVGMYPHTDRCLLEEDVLHNNLAVFDIIYNPLETELLKRARKKGAVTIPGLEMFLYQAVRQSEIWTGTEAPVDHMRNIILDLLRRSS